MHGMGEDNISRNLNFMKAYEGKIQSENACRSMADYMSSEVIYHPKNFTDESAEEYISQLERFAPHCQDIANSCRRAYENEKVLVPGNPVPDVKLKAPDGSEILLSSLFGKVLYIDLWATWCGPCCMEIPHLEKLVERFKGQNMTFVSLSVDKTDEPWLEKLQRDKPDWPQYRMNADEEEKLMGSLNIKAIPRFILLDKEGKIIDLNAPRPSSDEVDSVLQAAIQ